MAIDTGSVELDQADACGVTGLHLAALRGDTDCTQMLLAAGVDVNVADVAGQVRDVAGAPRCAHSRVCCAQTPLHYAVASQEAPTALLLCLAGADVDAEDDCGRTPLAVALALDVLGRRAPGAVARMLRARGARLPAAVPLWIAVRAVPGGFDHALC
jgi:hypothetical protein